MTATVTQHLDQAVEDARTGALIRALRDYGTSVEIITGRNHNSIRVGGLNPDHYPEHHADDTLATLRIKSTPNGTNVALVAHFGDDKTLLDACTDMVQFLFAHTPGATLRSVTA